MWTCSQQLINSWKYALDENMFARTLLIDLLKSFYCIPHGLLVAKMRVYKVNIDFCEFMSSYLHHRKIASS